MNSAAVRAAAWWISLSLFFICSSCDAFQIELPKVTTTTIARRTTKQKIRHSTTTSLALAWLDAPTAVELFTTTTTTAATVATAVATTSTLLSSSSSSLISPEPIHTAFSVATFLPQPFYILLILFPNTSFTKKIMGGFQVPGMFALLHFFIVVNSIILDNASAGGATAPLSDLNQVFDPSGDPQAAFGHMVQTYPNFVAEEWSHVLTWDFFVAWWIWQDGVRRDIFTSHSVLLCNLIGPPGLLLHWITCLLTGNPIMDQDQKVSE